MVQRSTSRGPIGAVPRTLADSLITEVAPGKRLLASVSGPRGSGKSALLDELETHYRGAGIRVVRDREDFDPFAAGEAAAFLFDDVHELGDAVLRLIQELVNHSYVDLVITHRMWPRSAALERLADAIERHHPPVLLGQLGREDVALRLETALGSPAPETLLDSVVELTSGTPWLVNRLTSAIHMDGGPVQDLLSRGLVDQVAYELDRLDPEVREFLLRLAVGSEPPGTVGTLVQRARALGLILPGGRLAPVISRALLETAPVTDPHLTAARRAQAAWASGDADHAGRIVDELLGLESPPDVRIAVDVGAAVWAQRGMLAHASQMYRWLGSAHVESSGGLAAVAMIGVGDREGAAEMLQVPDPAASPTGLAVAVGLMGTGIRDSVEGPASQALATLVRASDLMTAARVAVPLPDFPAALAALVALQRGELDVADTVLTAAIEGQQGGLVARQRLFLLRAWTWMLEDRSELAHAAIAEVGSSDALLAPRDELLLRALEVGLARRADDARELLRSWHRASESILHVPVDLYSLLPLGELLIAAARLRDSGRLDAHIKEAWDLLERLGNPPLWSVPLHWSAVQSAILAASPAALAPHAAALVRASSQDRLASTLAGAGRAWMSVLAGDFEVGAVVAAAQALASVGRTWDGSRLAAHAAGRAAEPKDMARLLACARELHEKRSSDEDYGLNEAPQAERTGHDAGLSTRERQVARLVLDGMTYREIGEAIFVSPRTAEHHIARIRRQLGATSRAELLAKLRHALDDHDAPAD